MRVVKYSQIETPEKSTVQLSFKTLSQLVELDDPSQYPHKELTEVAEDAIASHLGDVPSNREVELVLRLPTNELKRGVEENLAETIRQHFTFRTSEVALECTRKKSGLKLGVKITVTLVVILALAGTLLKTVAANDTSVQTLIVGVLTILAWAGIWDTFEAYVIEYRGELLRKLKVYEKAARMMIRIERA